MPISEFLRQIRLKIGHDPLLLPAVTAVVMDGAGHVLISFTSAANGTYTLHYTSPAGLNTPVTSWSTVSTNITGNGSVQTFTRPIGAAGTSTYYSVSVH